MENKIIFFVDDDKLIINLMEYTFRGRPGYDVRTFFTGEDCLKNLHVNPDLIILDHVFNKQPQAELNGLQTLIEIKKQKSEIPVVMLTSEDDSTLIKNFEKEGAHMYISKDAYFIDTLIETIEGFFKS